MRTFGSEMTVFLQREEAGGLAVLPYFLGRISWDTVVMITAYSAVYLGFYFTMTVFRTPFGMFYLVLICVAW